MESWSPFATVYTIFQRACAAFLAICERLLALSTIALALPPLDAPSFDSATAAGLRVSPGNGDPSMRSPIRSSTTDRARRFTSRGRLGLLARVGIAYDCGTVAPEETMDKVKTRDEMALILLEKKGFVLNERPEINRVHHATCESLSAMVASAHPKYFSTNRGQSEDWLNKRLGSDGWANCGRCGGLRSGSN